MGMEPIEELYAKGQQTHHNHFCMWCVLTASTLNHIEYVTSSFWEHAGVSNNTC